MKTAVLAITVIMYALIIAFRRKKAAIAAVSAILVVLLGVIFPGEIFPLPEDVISLEGESPARLYAPFHAVLEIVNWNVVMVYLGTMIVSALFIRSKAPEKIAGAIVARTSSSAAAVTAILALAGIISMFVENVAVVLVMAPVALSICDRVKINPALFMFGLVAISSLEGAATLVGDPPSMIFAGFASFTFNDFFFHGGHPSIFFVVQAGMAAGCAFFYVILMRSGRNEIQPSLEPVVSWVPFAFLVLMVLGLSAVSFLSRRFEFLSGTFVLGLGIAALIWHKLFQKRPALEILAKVDWEAIVFLLGIFIVIGAVKEAGILRDFALILIHVAGGSKFAGFLAIILVSVIFSGFIDNAPCIVALLPVAGAMAAEMNLSPELYLFALLAGICLGGNLTPLGAGANVVASGILKKQGHPVSFTGWLKLGVPFTILTVAAASFALWIVRA